jgi:hypothetical protein
VTAPPWGHPCRMTDDDAPPPAKDVPHRSLVEPDHEPADRDDREVPLDDPELTELPVEDDDPE